MVLRVVQPIAVTMGSRDPRTENNTSLEGDRVKESGVDNRVVEGFWDVSWTWYPQSWQSSDVIL